LFVAEPKESLLTFELYDLFIEAGGWFLFCFFLFYFLVLVFVSVFVFYCGIYSLDFFCVLKKIGLLTFFSKKFFSLFEIAIDDVDSRVDHLKCALQQLPPGNLAILKRVFGLLKSLTAPENLQYNKMVFVTKHKTKK
jgi:hypothetical protein